LVPRALAEALGIVRASMDNQTAQPKVSFTKPLVILALPFILFLPTLWFFHGFIPEHSEAAQRLGEVEHMRVHWGVFWIVAFLPFSAICLISSLVMFLLRLRKR
jgi:hypothetical protein